MNIIYPIMQYCATIIPVYASTNERLKYFDDCLKSVVRQSHPTIGVIVDDGSPKFEDVKQIVKNNNNGFLRLIQRKRYPDDRKTASNALNYGLEKVIVNSNEILNKTEENRVRGVCYLHSDDMLAKESIKKRVELLKNNSFVYSRLYKIDSESRPIDIYGCGENILQGAGSFAHHTIMWDINFLKGLRLYIRKKFNQIGIFDKNLCAGEDRDVSLSSIEFASEIEKPFKFLDDCTYLYRKQKNDSICSTMSVFEKLGNSQEISLKHNIPSISFFVSRMGYNLPYSFFTYCPESFKSKFRPAKRLVDNLLSHGSLNLNFPPTISDDPLLNIK